MQSKFNILKEIIDNVGITPKIAQYYAKWMDRKYVSWEDLEHDCEVEEEFTEKF